MNWIEYNEKLGLGFSDYKKTQLLMNNMITFINQSNLVYRSLSSIFLKFCLITGTSYPNDTFDEFSLQIISNVFKQCHDTKELLAYFIAFVNSTDKDSILRTSLISFLTMQLSDINIGFEIYKEDNNIYFFPKGAKEFDDTLLAEPLDWLCEYPKSKTAFIKALTQYSNSEYCRDVADNLRKALEEFLHEFFYNKKNLSSNISEVGTYIKSACGSEEITNMFHCLLKVYHALNNKSVKHHDNFDPKFLEFLLYQTGLFIRMLIVVKRELN